MTEPAQSDALPLPEVVRQRVVALAAEVLPQVPSLPAGVRKIAAFAPARRARVGGTPIGAALADDEFRRQVATCVAAEHPELEAASGDGAGLADPVDAAAMLWLSRPDGWKTAYADALARLGDATPPRGADEVDRLRRRLEDAEQAVRDVRERTRAQVEALKAENASLRRKLGEARAAQRAGEASTTEAVAAAQAARDAADAAASAAELEARRLRDEVEQLRTQLAAVRRDVRADREGGTLRARLLLDTLLDAAQGLRRELALPPVTGSPGERVEEELARAGTRDPSSAGALGPSSPALLEQYLAMPRVRLIVDGYNVSKTAWPESSLEAQRIRLLNALAPLVARVGAETTVVFDAAATSTRPVVNAPRGVKVLFSPEGVIADDVIRDLVAAEPPGRVVVVVSSDQEVAQDVRRAGARVVESAALVGLLGRG